MLTIVLYLYVYSCFAIIYIYVQYTIEIPYEQQLLAEAGDVLGMFTYANATNEVIGHISVS